MEGRLPGSRSRSPDIFIIVPGSLPIAEDRLNIGGRQDPGEVVGHDITDGAVAGTFNRTGCDHVPEGDMMREEKFLFLINGDGDWALKDSGQSLPEPVLRMMIEKMTFPGFDRREGTEDQNPGDAVKTGGIGCVTVFMINILSDIF